ncbi:MAG: rRNA maturation RNase YbeY [Acidobacteria bacterium]|nr:rRNA maturation RNase YbeY [Acidobacteriota bacterium]
MSAFLADEQKEQLDLTGLHSLAELVLREESYPDSTELTVLFVDESEMSSYNARFLDREGPTDVLAFPVEELTAGEVPEIDPLGPPLILGDVIIAPTYVGRQAEDMEVSLEDEMALMVTHGILHLIGYDHQTDQEAELMEGREAEILRLVGRVRR